MADNSGKISSDTKSVSSVNSLDEGGPWGLVIIIAAFMIQVFAFGTSCSIGVYNIEFLDYFDNDVNGVSLLTSINIAFFMGGGLLANWLASKFSHRAMALIGAAGMVSGLFAMAWMDSLESMIPFYGVLVGLGGCFAYAPSHTLSGLYYNKYRSLATGLATSGSGLGTAVFPPLISFLIEEYSWRGSLIFLAGLNLHIFIFAMLLRPPPPQEPLLDEEGKEGEETNETEVNNESGQKLTKAQLCRKKYCLFTDFGFMVYFVSNILWNNGASIFLAFGPEFFRSAGLSNMDASFMMTLFGLGEFVGGIIGGIVGNVPKLNRIYIYQASCLIGGAMIFLFPLTDIYAVFGTLSFFFGLCFGILLGLLIIVFTDLIGTDNIGIGLGYILLADGIGAFMGPPIAGILEEEYGGYDTALYLSGIATALAGLLMFLILLQRKICEKLEDSRMLTGIDNPAIEEGSPSPMTPRRHGGSLRRRLSEVAHERGLRSLKHGSSLKSKDGKTNQACEFDQKADPNNQTPSPVKSVGSDVVDITRIDLDECKESDEHLDMAETADRVRYVKGKYQAVETSEESPRHGYSNQVMNDENKANGSPSSPKQTDEFLVSPATGADGIISVRL